MTRRWEPRSAQADASSGSAPLLDRVLAARGLQGDSAAAYLSPSLRSMHDPSSIPDLDRAAERLLDAVRAREAMVIYGDYDVDGVTASAILVHTLRAIDPDAAVSTYIPHRLDEGYGINAEAITQLASDGARVIVSVDCGITAIEPARVAKRLGVDLIITDHHNPPASMADLPEAYAVVHPRRPDSSYPFGELCGAGVAYKLAWRLCTLHAGSDKVTPACRDTLIEMLGLAALGSIADVVPLIDENRVIVRHGLNQLARTRHPGLSALIRASRLDSDKVDCDAVGFRLAPRLNAVGRLGHAREALELLTDASGLRATQLAETLSRVNDERRGVERAIFEQADAMAQAAGMTGADKRAIVLAHPDWHPGVVGIACSRLVEKHARPVVLMQLDAQAGLCKGSGRSIGGYNLHAALDACADLLDRYGGHDMAAGMACRASNLDALTERLIEHANSRLSPADLIPRVRYDAVAMIGELSTRTVEQIERLAPFGQGNPRVRVRVSGRLNGRPDMLGSTGNHLALRLGETGHPGVRVLAWNWGCHAASIPPGARVEAIVEPKLSRWNGSTRVEPVLADLRVLSENEDRDHSVGTVAYEPVRS
ncbi:MAG: single-stranded-DNA-specific exonuclease RecJ [Phycisphaerales bacterium]|nr:single-stranded-DNA-specific exonuclease RecJ [Phycisphaerales bacterium]